MTSERLPLLVLFAVAVVALVGACQQPSTSDVDQTEEGVLRLGSVEAVDTLARAVAPNNRPLVVDGFRGGVALRGVDRETAELRFVRRGRGEDAETARGVLEDVTVTESGSQDSYTYTLESEGAAYAAVDVTGTVPRGTELRLEQSIGPVTVRDVRGPITVRRDHGPVTLRGTGDSVDVELRNGEIEVHAAVLPPDATVRLRTENGDVTLRVPPTSSAGIAAQTSAGVIRTQGLPLTEEHFSPQDAGGRYDAQLGMGGASVELRTENGSILIAATDTSAAPADTSEASPGPDVVSAPSDTTVGPETAPDPAAEAPTPDTTTPADTTAPPDTTAP
mgnify:CR=1 FL=1